MKKTNFLKESLKLHKKYNGKLDINLKASIKNKDDLSIFYSPGVAGPCLEILKKPKLKKDLTINGRCVAVITNGTAVLGLGDIGPEASLPVIEGKSALFKEFANIDSFPLSIDTKNIDEFVSCVKLISKNFAGINLEDIKAPECFEIENRLKKDLKIPVFHDDQHGTAIVVLAGVINSLKILNKKKDKVKILVNGVGAAGVSIIKLLSDYGIKNIIACDSKGILSKKRSDLNKIKKEILKITNKENISGKLEDGILGCDIFIGVSKADILEEKHIKKMNKNPVVFGLANPNPEISIEKAKKYGVKIFASGRSDYPNQINNVLVFPSIFKAVLEKNIPQILDKHKIKMAKNLANFVKKPSVKKIIPGPFEKGLVDYLVKNF